ncbi:PAQR family membrane homeostasis protein TrhA [Planctomicrobium sp. SH527]|uniref:PAQR family membrane homeostasis protein TrhA n=1 Tax=Planctomicrobium sp. SH527 TaxID=3448123 RepID=UPI003F5CB2B1
MQTETQKAQDTFIAVPKSATGNTSLPETPFRSGDIRPVDEFANFLTHGVGFLLSLVGAAVLIFKVAQHADLWMAIACVVYSITLVGLYLASTLSHAFHDPSIRRYFRTLDQACIFLLISGSYTPFAATYLRDGLWPLLTIAMWVIALVGAWLVFHWGFLSASAQKLYILMGWLPVISLPTIIQSASPETVAWIVVGGMLYTVGTLFLWYDKYVRYFHATWHLSVIGASIAHYLAITSLLP